jgi:UDP-glucose 4-epimerase
MCTLVTGGAGYIGSHMIWKLLDEGEQVVALDDLSTGFAWAVPPGVRIVIGDVGDQALVRRILREYDVSAIVHFAASLIVPDSVMEPLQYYENNTMKSRALIECAIEAGVHHFIFSSTAAVYGSPERCPVDEDAPLLPESPYGSSKLMAEVILRDAAVAHGLTFSILRYFNVCGADPGLRAGEATHSSTHLIKVASETALGLRPQIDVFGTDYATPDGSCVRDYIHVTDLVDAHYLALQRLRGGGDNLVANCGYGSGYSVLEVIEAVKRAVGRDFAVRYAGRRAGDAVAIVANADRARRELGWQPRFDDLRTIVSHALAWERKLQADRPAGGRVERRRGLQRPALARLGLDRPRLAYSAASAVSPSA